MHFDLVFVILFSIATGVALAARWLKVPYTVALVVAGLMIGAGDWVEAPHLSKELLFAVFLPGLLFEAAFHLEAKSFWANKLAITTLAVPGVVVAIGTTALILSPVLGLTALEADFRLVDGLVFGGIIAATDPIAVVALFKSLGAPKRLAVLAEGESLLNDGTAVVLFSAILAAAAGAEVTVGGAVLDFVRTCGVGILVGGVVGYAGSKIIHFVDDPMIEITVTVVLAWGSFAFAEQIHASGVLATVAAGLLCGNHAAPTGMAPGTKIAANTFWSYIAFALNSVVFLLIGFEVDLRGVLDSWAAVLLAWIATTAARALVVALVSVVLRRSKEKLPRFWPAVICWSGIRGGLSMVLVLALPHEFPHRQFLVDVVFGVVLVSILAQGLTIAPLLKRLGIVSAPSERAQYERERASSLATNAALAEIDALEDSSAADPRTLDALRSEYTTRAAEAAERIRSFQLADARLEVEERARVERHLILVEKVRIQKAVAEGLASDEATVRLLADLDARLLSLDSDHDH